MCRTEPAVVALNVGGQRYDVARDTLHRVRESKLSRMFSSEPPEFVLDGSGAAFIDRDGALFAHVLRFLRDADDWTPPCTLEVLAPLRNEARFFLLDDMERMVMEALFRLDVRCPRPASHFPPPVCCGHSFGQAESSPGSTSCCESFSDLEEMSPIDQSIEASCQGIALAAQDLDGDICSRMFEDCDSVENYTTGFYDLADLAVDVVGDLGGRLGDVVDILAGAVVSPFYQKRGFCA